jgi:hypothetical protein
MWALTSRRAKRTSGLEEISLGGKKDFFNTIGTAGVAVRCMISAVDVRPDERRAQFDIRRSTVSCNRAKETAPAAGQRLEPFYIHRMQGGGRCVRSCKIKWPLQQSFPKEMPCAQRNLSSIAGVCIVLGYCNFQF